MSAEVVSPRHLTATTGVYSELSRLSREHAFRELWFRQPIKEPMMRREGDQLQPLPAEQLLRNEEKKGKAAQTAVKPI